MDAPLALFITWTVYGTFLPGDARGWRHKDHGNQPASPRLESWHRDRLRHEIVLLSEEMRGTAENALREICQYRPWILWSLSVRSNHVHVVVTAPGYRPSLVRDQLKGKATSKLRKYYDVWKGRPIWAAKGDIEFLDTESEIENCVIYVNDAQDRKGRDR